MAGTISATPNPAAEGSIVQVSIAGGTSGDSVEVTVTNGEGGATSHVTIVLDEDGDGSASWTVPSGWAAAGAADFDAPGLTGCSIIINP